MSSTTSISFQGIASGVQTDALVSAIMAQDSLPLDNLQATQTENNNESSALTTLQTDMTSLATSLQTLQFSSSGFNARTVTSSDTGTSVYVTGTATGTTPGNYQVQVDTVATAGRIVPTLQGNGDPNLAVADPSGGGTSQIYTPGGTPASFAIQGTDGSVKVVTLNAGDNSLNGLASAINAAYAGAAPGAGVTASIVNTGSGATPYQMVLTANSTGTGSTNGVVSIADVTNNDGSTTDNLIGIAAGTVDSLAAPTTISGGLTSPPATNAVFTLNGIQLTRQTNTVTDAVQGLTLNLQQGGETAPTTLTVGEDTATISDSVQAVITSYNSLVGTFNSDTKSTQASTGDIIPGALANDPTAAQLMSQIQQAFTGVPQGLPASSAYQSIGDLGITENSDGTLSMDSDTFSTAITSNPNAAAAIFNFTGTTSNGVANFVQGGGSTTAQKIAFNITSYDGDTGSWSGTLAADGGTPIAVSGTKGGNVTATGGAPLGSLTGLELDVTGTGTGTLSLTTGVAQSTQNVINNLTAFDGPIWNTQQSITSANADLANQISAEQQLLSATQNQLENQFASMEASVAQMKVASAGMVSSSTSF
jgi:flagellar hook-associated protein 2